MVPVPFAVRSKGTGNVSLFLASKTSEIWSWNLESYDVMAQYGLLRDLSMYQIARSLRADVIVIEGAWVGDLASVFCS